MSEMLRAFSITYDWPYLLGVLECMAESHIDLQVCISSVTNEPTHLVLSLNYFKWTDGPEAPPWMGLSTAFEINQVATLNNQIYNLVMNEITRLGEGS